MLRRFATLVLVATAAVALTGCFKLKHRTTVMPDGSGKFTMTFGMSMQMYDLMKATVDSFGEVGAPAADPLVGKLADLPEAYEGAVAYGKPVRYDKDGFAFAEMTAYFEDVSKFKVRKSPLDRNSSEADAETEPGDPPPKDGSMAFGWKRTDAGFTLTVDNRLLGDKDKEMTPKEGASAQEKEQAKALAKALLTGFELSETYELPGDVLTADEPLKKAGRTASCGVTIDDLLEHAEQYEKHPPFGARTISCGRSTVTDAEVTAFREEMAAAKSAWAKLLAEEAAAKKDAPKPAGEAPKGPDDDRVAPPK